MSRRFQALAQIVPGLEIARHATREQTLADHQALMSSLSQPRAVLFLIRELFEQVPENACSSQIMLIDSGIRTLTFLIGDKKYKAGKRNAA